MARGLFNAERLPSGGQDAQVPHSGAATPITAEGPGAARADGSATPLAPTAGDYARMAELVWQYRDLPLGAADASIVAPAEQLGVTAIATVDRRDFGIVRPRHVDAFELVSAL